MKKFYFISLMLLTLNACQSDNSSIVNNTQDQSATIQFENVLKFEYADAPQGHFVINDEAAWFTFAESINAPLIYNPETGANTNELLTADIDFSAYTVIAVVDALHNHGGYDIEITSVARNDAAVAVTVETAYPGDGAVTTVLTQPYHIIKIPKTTLPVVFEEQ